LAANVAYAVAMTPLIVETLGVQRYGVWSFLNGLLAYSELLYLGLGSALVKHIAGFRAKNNHLGVDRVSSVVASLYAVIGMTCFAVLVAARHSVPGWFAEPLPPELASATSVTCVLLGARLFLIFVTSAFAGALAGHDRFDLINLVNLLNVALRAILTLILLGRGEEPLITLAAIMSAGVALDGLLLAVIMTKGVPHLRVRPVLPSWLELKALYAFGIQSFFILFAVKLITYTDTTVIGVMMGAESVALYSLPLQLVEYARLCIAGFAGVFLPRVSVAHARGDATGLQHAYVRVMRIAFFLAGWLAALLWVLGPSFLNSWVGPQVSTAAKDIMPYLCLGLLAQIVTSHSSLPFYQALHALSMPAAVLTAEAAVNLALTILLIPSLGLEGVALGTAAAACVSLFVLPRYLCRRIGISLWAFLSRSLGPGALTFATLFLTQQLITFAVGEPTSFMSLALRVTITAPLPVLTLLIASPEERVSIVEELRNRGRNGSAKR
jgi:O-antigen/teichoic acid export membrane protein